MSSSGTIMVVGQFNSFRLCLVLELADYALKMSVNLPRLIVSEESSGSHEPIERNKPFKQRHFVCHPITDMRIIHIDHLFGDMNDADESGKTLDKPGWTLLQTLLTHILRAFKCG